MNSLPGSDICVSSRGWCFLSVGIVGEGHPLPPPGGGPPSLVFSHRFWSDTGRRCVGKYQDFGHLVLLMVYFYIFLYHQYFYITSDQYFYVLQEPRLDLMQFRLSKRNFALQKLRFSALIGIRYYNNSLTTESMRTGVHPQYFRVYSEMHILMQKS